MLSWLFDRLAAAPERAALIHIDQGFSYGWLLERTAARAAEFQGLGLTSQVVALETDYGPESCAALLALLKCGAIVVPLAGELGEARLTRFRAIAQVGARVVGPNAATVLLEARTPTHPLLLRQIKAQRPALVLLSSGSTGTPKAAVHDFPDLLEKFRVPRQRLRTLAFLLLDHIGGQNTLFYTLANGGTLVTVGARDPDTVCAAIERHQVELLPTSPTFLNLLLISGAIARHDLHSLTTVTYGTEPMPASTLTRAHAALPGVRFQQTYGLSELGILRSRSRASDSLWVQLGGPEFETRVVDGLLHVRPRHGMLGYLNAPSPYDADGWFNTGDAVVVEGDYMRILGRRSELINVGGLKVHPAEVESVLLELPYVADAAVRGESHPITGQIVVARVTLAEQLTPAELRRRVRRDCAERLAPHAVPVRIEVSDAAQHNVRFKRVRTPDPTD